MGRSVPEIVIRRLAALLVYAAGAPLVAQNVTYDPAWPDPILFLLREPAVQAELALTDAQRLQLEQWNEHWDSRLLASRHMSDEDANRTVADALQKTRERVEVVLDDPQRRRLQQIAYRLRGISMLLLPDVQQQLRIAPDQQTAIEAEVTRARDKIIELRQGLAAGQVTREQAEAQSLAVRRKEQLQVLDRLDDSQRSALVQLIGDDFDMSLLGHVTFKAPDFPGPGPWLNSPALRVSALKGQVVVVHFFAFGCSNCIHNYPWYQQWQAQFAPRGVTLIGVHTPETEVEHDVQRLREKVDEQGWRFPVVADNDRAIWKAWGNTMWPSVYLIDKQGRIRYWWYGELDWQGAGGHRIMADKIEQLLSEERTDPGLRTGLPNDDHHAARR